MAEGKKIRLRDGFHALARLWKHSRSSRAHPASATGSKEGLTRAGAFAGPWSRACAGLIVTLCSLLYAAGVVVLTGLIPGPGRWYSASPWYRMQVAAILRGDLALSRNPADLAHDLCWSEGGVHQVWGLGIPLWRLPLECLARLANRAPFPDMLAFGLALALSTGLLLPALPSLFGSNMDSTVGVARCRKDRNPGPPETAGRPGQAGDPPHVSALLALAGAVLVLLLFPPLFRLLRSRFWVYEEAIAYEYLAGLCMMALLIRLAVRPRPATFWLLCGVAGYSMWIRPTLVFHGAAALVAGAWTLFYAGETGGLTPVPSGYSAGTRWRRFARQVAPGTILYVCLGLGLYWTNLLRFGNGFEFGHRLNIQPGLHGSMYCTRFDHPFRNEPLWRAARELFGFLFLPRHPNPAFWSDPTAVTGISPTPRWREVAHLAYDPFYLVWAAAGWASAGFMIRRLMRRTCGAYTESAPNQDTIERHPMEVTGTDRTLMPAVASLGLQSFLATMALCGFYLRNCVISTRYMFDFMPAFAAGMLAAWLAWTRFCRRRRRPVRWLAMSLVAMSAWLSWQMDQRLGNERQPRALSWNEVLQSTRPERQQQVRIPADGSYEGPEEAAQAGMLQDACGWSPNTGHLMASAYFFVRDPEFIELDLAMDPNIPLCADPRHVRAKIGLETLRIERAEQTPDGWRLRFAGPTQSRYRRGVQPLFVATVLPEQVAEANPSPWRLLQLRWRAGPHQPQQQDEHPQTR